MSEISLIGERDAHRIGHVARTRAAAGGGESRVLQVVLLAGVNVAMDRIQRNDAGEERGLT